MPESLGDALLYLRTDDSAFTAGVGAAEGKAVKLGGTLDRTTAKSGELSTALTRTGGAAKTAARELDTASRSAAGSSAAFVKSSAAVNTSVGAQRAGVQNLTRQIGDMATMYSLGARPALIFSSQIGQIADAVQQAMGGTSKLAAFLTGPWGVALMIGVQLLGPFIGKLLDGADAATTMADQQSVLAQYIDTTTGKIKAQVAAISLLVEAQRQSKSLAQQTQDYQRNRNALAGAASEAGNGEFSGNLFAPGNFAKPALTASQQQIKALGEQYRRGEINANALGLAVHKIGAEDPSVRKITDDIERLADTTVRSAQSAVKTQALIAVLSGTASDEQKKLLGIKTGEDAAKPGTGGGTATAKRSSSASTIERDSHNAAELARLGQEETRAQLDLTTNIDDRAQLQMELLTQERADRVREIDSNKSLTAKERAARLALIDRLYGNPNSSVGPNGEIVVDGNDVGLYGQKVMRDVREREARLANDALSRQSAALGAQASITTNLKERDALEQKILELQQQIQRNVLEQQIANGDVADAVKARATLAKQQAVQREGLSRSQEGPLAAYARSLNASNDNLDAQVQSYIVDELQSVRDSLHAGIRKITGTDDPLINGLIQMFIEQTLIRPIANSLSQVNGLGGGGGGLFGSLLHGLIGAFGGGGSVTGWLNGGSTAGLGFGGSFTTIAGMRATGGPIAAGNAYLVGERGPEIVVPHAPGYVLPNGSAPAGGKGDFNLSVTVNGARGNAEIQEMVNAGVKQGIAGYDEVVANRVQDHLRRRSS